MKTFGSFDDFVNKICFCIYFFFFFTFFFFFCCCSYYKSYLFFLKITIFRSQYHVWLFKIDQMNVMFLCFFKLPWRKDFIITEEGKEIIINILCNLLHYMLIHYKLINFIHLNKEKYFYNLYFFVIPILFQANRWKKWMLNIQNFGYCIEKKLRAFI